MEEHRTKFLTKGMLSSFEDLKWHRASTPSCVSSPTIFKRKVNWDKYHLYFLENTSPGSFTTFCSCWFLLVLDHTSVHFFFPIVPENQVWLFLSLPVVSSVSHQLNYMIILSNTFNQKPKGRRKRCTIFKCYNQGRSRIPDGRLHVQ